MEITFNQAVIVHQEGKLEKAEHLYGEILKIEPTHPDANHNLGVIRLLKNDIEGAIILFKKTISIKPDYADAYSNLGASFERLSRFEEAEESYKKAIELEPEYVGAHFNLGNTLKALKKLDEAEASFKKAINLKPDYAEVHNNLGTLLEELDRLDEAEASFKKAVKIKPKYFEAYNNLGNVLKKLDKLNEAEKNYKKAIELKPDYDAAHLNLALVSSQNELLSKIIKEKNSIKNKNIFNDIDADKRLSSNPFIVHRDVESELINSLYKFSYKGLGDTKGIFFGKGRHSMDFKLFKNNLPIIKKVEDDLTNIMKQAVKSNIFIIDSFFNILCDGGGSVPHTHVTNFDKLQGLVKQKYSLTYHLSVGDQNCKEPGILKLQDPYKEILPSKGMVMIFPADRKHSAAYSGSIDRVMIGVNFYSVG